MSSSGAEEARQGGKEEVTGKSKRGVRGMERELRGVLEPSEKRCQLAVNNEALGGCGMNSETQWGNSVPLSAVPPDDVQMDRAEDDRRLERGVAAGSIVSSSTAAEAAVAIKCEKDSTVRTLGDKGAPPDVTRRMLL